MITQEGFSGDAAVILSAPVSVAAFCAERLSEHNMNAIRRVYFKLYFVISHEVSSKIVKLYD
jgi:hypothetical protein